MKKHLKAKDGKAAGKTAKKQRKLAAKARRHLLEQVAEDLDVDMVETGVEYDE